MKVKRVAAGLLCACLCVSVTTACSGGGSSSQSSSQSEAKKTEPKGKDIRKLYIRAPKSAEEMTATFWNTASGKTADVKMNKTDESGGSIIYCCDADANLYNMAMKCGAPVIGLGFSTSATDGLYIPTFITSFIQESVLYSSLLGIIVPILLIIGIANLYILHGVVLDGLSVKDSNRQSYRIMRSNYKNYIKENVLFFLALGAVIALIAAITIAVPLVLTQLIPMPPACYRFLVVLFITAGALVYLYVDLFMIPLYFMKMTQLYYRYKYDMVFENRVAEEKRRRFNRVLASLWAAAFLAAVISQFVCFDTWYPAESNVGIIAHRAGGVEAPENTVAGIETAYKIGADGCEIDIQRTKDGFYVLNHDADFKRTAGEKKTPEEMDLREIKELRVDGEPVAEFEETLAAAKGKLTLYTELKGNTADKKMADDAVRLIHKYGMEDECVLISLKYDLIDYIQTEYPDIETGFLTFAAFGNTPDLNCDCIGLEAESATAY